MSNLYAENFTEATTAYENGEYTTAAELFEAIAQSDETAATRHNLALSYFQLGQLAEAAWQVERALRIDPLKTEYHFKLGALRQQLGLFENTPEWHVVGAQLLHTKTWIWIACISFWLLIAALILPRLGGIPTTLGITTVRILSIVLLALSVPALWLNFQLSQNGIVISETPVDIHAAPANAAPSAGVARPGERAQIIDQHNDFYRIETEGRAAGWINRAAFRPLAL